MMTGKPHSFLACCSTEVTVSARHLQLKRLKGVSAMYSLKDITARICFHDANAQNYESLNSALHWSRAEYS